MHLGPEPKANKVPVCNAVTDDETLSTSHILFPHRRKLNLGWKDEKNREKQNFQLTLILL